MSKKMYLMAVGMSLSAVLAMTACNSTTTPKAGDNADQQQTTQQTEKKDDSKKDEVTDLKDWSGTWNNFVNYLDDPQLNGAFEEAAKDQKVSVDEARKDLKETRKFEHEGTEWGGVKIHDNTIEYLDKFDADGGKVVAKGEYKFVTSKEVMHGNQKMSWYVFEATNADAPSKYVALLPVHGEEEMTHFHMRYGSSIEDMLKNDLDWYPTLVKPDTTFDQLGDEVKEG